MPKNPVKKRILSALFELFTRLTFLAFLVALFLLAVIYVSRNVTYEYGSSEVSADREEAAPSGTAPVDDGTRILRFSEQNAEKICIYRPDGTLERSLGISSDALTDLDLDLLSKGVTLCKTELEALLSETDALIPY